MMKYPNASKVRSTLSLLSVLQLILRTSHKKKRG